VNAVPSPTAPSPSQAASAQAGAVAALDAELQRASRIARESARRCFWIQIIGGALGCAVIPLAGWLVVATRQPWWVLLFAASFWVNQAAFEWSGYVLAAGRQPMRELWERIGRPYPEVLRKSDLRNYHFWNDVGARIRARFIRPEAAP